MRKAFLYLSVILFLASCVEEETPDYLWDEERFVDVLIEMQKAEAMIRLSYNRIADTVYNPDSIYSAALEKVGASRADYDSNYNYYLEDPKRFEDIFENVIIRLSEASALVEKDKKSSKKRKEED